eukprot:COSAG06_NODE_8923_length_2031_cov_25.465839_3_plen_34_part_00
MQVLLRRVGEILASGVCESGSDSAKLQQNLHIT